jgi:hypothetical protein
MRGGRDRFWQWGEGRVPFDVPLAVRYMLIPMTRAATFFGYWFSYPLHMAEAGTRA